MDESGNDPQECGRTEGMKDYQQTIQSPAGKVIGREEKCTALFLI